MKRVGFSGTVLAALLMLPTGLSSSQAGAAVLDDGLLGGSSGAAASASAADITPTEVTALSAERFGGTLQVSGNAVFGGEAPFLIAEDPSGDAPFHPEFSRLGIDVTGLFIHQPDPDVPEIDFVINVTQLDSPPPPEVVRYLWQLKVGGEEYWIQAKTSDLSSGSNLLDDPDGAVQNTQGAFRLRGNCGPQEVPLPDPVGPVSATNTCNHVAWLDGVFDTDANQIRVTVPLDLGAAPEFGPGASIPAELPFWAAIQAGFSNASTSDTVTPEFDYRIPTKDVQVGIAPAGTPPQFVDIDTPANVADDGSFTGDLDLAGLAPGSYDVYAEGCFGANCGVATATVTVQ